MVTHWYSIFAACPLTVHDQARPSGEMLQNNQTCKCRGRIYVCSSIWDIRLKDGGHSDPNDLSD